MIILIGGAGCAGKTLMAQRLLEKYGFPYLSLDHLKMGLCRSGAACGFTPESNDFVISARLWPIVRGIIMTAVENRQNLIIEGCYLPPDKIAALGREYLDSIISFGLILSRDYVIKNIAALLEHRCDIERRLYPETRTAEEIADENDRYATVYAQTGARYFTIKADYEAELAAVYAWLDGEVSRLRTAEEQ